jgi:hypothetical protein
MFNISSLVQKAQSYIEPTLNNIAAPATTDRRPSKATLFRHQFRLPDTQNPLQEITAELTLPPHHSTRGAGDVTSGDKDRSQGNHYVGKLHLSEQYLCFSTQGSSFVNTATLSSSSSFTGQTHGAGPAGNGFTLPLCGIRRVERLHSQSYMFALAITTWNGVPDSKTQIPAGQKLTIQLAGSRQACERFCDGLKKGLREGVKEVENLRKVVGHCYSEYLLTDAEEKKTTEDGAKPGKEHPDTGLGILFRYPGNARKLRDATKIRLWREYLRGTFDGSPHQVSADMTQIMGEALRSSASPPSTSSSVSACQTDSEAKCGSLHRARSFCVFRTPRSTPTLYKSMLGESR